MMTHCCCLMTPVMKHLLVSFWMAQWNQQLYPNRVILTSEINFNLLACALVKVEVAPDHSYCGSVGDSALTSPVVSSNYYNRKVYFRLVAVDFRPFANITSISDRSFTSACTSAVTVISLCSEAASHCLCLSSDLRCSSHWLIEQVPYIFIAIFTFTLRFLLSCKSK